MERNSRPDPNFEGIEMKWILSTTDARILMLMKEDPKDYIEEDGKKGYLKRYTNILESYKDAFRSSSLLERRGGKQNFVSLHKCCRSLDLSKEGTVDTCNSWERPYRHARRVHSRSR